jgi:ABC-type transport system involved in multi-copper enzyme maturation permease subunit
MTAQLGARPVESRLPALKVTQRRVISSEWTKFRSLRSTNITLLVAIVLTVGLGALISGVTAAHWAHADPGERAHFNATARSLAGVNISQLAIGVLGVLLITGEYATGMIRASLTVVPKRLPVLWAKLVVFVVVVGPLAFASTLGAFFAGQALLSSRHIQATLSTPHAFRMVIGAAGYLVLVGVIGLALGAVLRNTAAGISALVALFFVIPPLMDLLPTSWSDHIGPYLPSNAGSAFWGNSDGVHLTALKGFVVLCIWAAAAIAAAAVRLKSHDA